MLSGKKILIVGSGPSSFAFLKAVTEKQKCEIDLIDSSSITLLENEECVFKNQFLGSRMPVNKRQLDKDPLISEHFGGFSIFWGPEILKYSGHFDISPLKNRKSN